MTFRRQNIAYFFTCLKNKINIIIIMFYYYYYLCKSIAFICFPQKGFECCHGLSAHLRKGILRLRASEIVHGCSVPVGLLKASAYFRQRHTVKQMEVSAVCHFTLNQGQQRVWVWLSLSRWNCPLSYTDGVGFFVVNLLFLSICLFIWREYVCVHTSGQAAVVRQQWQTRGRERKERMTD